MTTAETAKYARAPMHPAAGIVRIHAQTILTVTPHLTALMRRMAPKPTIEPAMVCVVLTGMPAAAVANRVAAAPVSRKNRQRGPIW